MRYQPTSPGTTMMLQQKYKLDTYTSNPTYLTRTIYAILLCASWFTIYPIPYIDRLAKKNPQFNFELGLDQYWTFPLIGFLHASVLTCLYVAFSSILPENLVFLSAAIPAALLQIASGGIHLDGLIDTIDALHTVPTERRIKVLHEPTVGAIGVAYAMTVYLTGTLLFTAVILTCVSPAAVLITTATILVTARAAGLLHIHTLYEDESLTNLIQPYSTPHTPTSARRMLARTTVLYFISVTLFSAGAGYLSQPWNPWSFLLVPILWSVAKLSIGIGRRIKQALGGYYHGDQIGTVVIGFELLGTVASLIVAGIVS